MNQEIYFSQGEELEINILRIMVESLSPIGAGLLFEKLVEDGSMVSEATISRLLRRMDSRKITKRIGYQGRLVTEKGKLYLQELEQRRKHNQYGVELMNILEKSSHQELLDILLVRKVLEKEAVKLAVMTATDEDIMCLENLIKNSEKILTEPEKTAMMDSNFHEIIAEMTRNNVLKSTLQLLMQKKEVFKITGLIRRRVGTALVKDHIRIIEAIKKRDKFEAEKAMEDHIDAVIRDVNKYLELINNKKLPNPIEDKIGGSC
ncbi:MAG: FCD domain-containing protein [Bacillota bacterium]